MGCKLLRYMVIKFSQETDLGNSLITYPGPAC